MADVFKKYNANSLLDGKHILFIGDSNIRALYKDLICLYRINSLIEIRFLKRKLEESFLGDKLLSRSELTRGRNFTEHRIFKDGGTTIEFLFVTRCYCINIIKLVEGIKTGTKHCPDVIVMNSCLWDVSRWGPNGVNQYKTNMEKLMKLLSTSLPKRALFIWATALPIATLTSGGLLIKQTEFLQAILRIHVIEANAFTAALVSSYGFDVLDFHHYMRYQIIRRSADGIHFLPAAIRFLTNLHLTHIALSWDVKLPRNSKNFTSALAAKVEKAREASMGIEVQQICKKIGLLADTLNITGKTRKDGKPYNEGNIKYAYRFKRRDKTQETPSASTQKSISQRRKRQAETTEETTQRENKSARREGTPVPGPSTGRTQRSIFDSVDFGGPEEMEEEDIVMMNDSVGNRERKDVNGATGTGSGSSAVAGSANRINYIQAARAGRARFSFEHTHLINTWGNAFKILTLGDKLETKTMITSLACLPVNAVCFWMSYAEYRALPVGTRIESVECIVIPKGFKTSFDTGVSVTSSANNTQGVFGQVGVGLNRHLLCRNFEVSRSATKPMHIDTIARLQLHDISERLWGYEKFDDTKFNASIPTCVGISRSLKLYLGLLMPYKAEENRNKEINTGWPDMMKCTKTFNFLDHIEKPVVHYKYNVKTNCIRTKKTQTIISDDIHHKSAMGGEDISICAGALTKEEFKLGKITTLTSVPTNEMTFDKYISEHVEHCHSVTVPDHTPPNSGHAQPSLHIGILPIQSNAPDKEIQDYITACGTWEVKTHITLSTDFHNHYTFDNINGPSDVPFGVKPDNVAALYHNTVFGFAPAY